METETTTIVKVWMNWMALVLFASVVFMWKHKPARFVFVAMLATLAVVLYIWHLSKNVHLFGVAHILIWFPLAIYLSAEVLSKKGREFNRPRKAFFTWICLLVATIITSLIFDIRDIYMVIMGTK